MKRHATCYESGHPSRRLARTRVARRDRLSVFNQLVLENRSVVYNLAYGVLGDPDLAVTATEDTFLRAFPALPEYRGKPLKQWLMRIAVTVCQEQMRRLPHLVLDSCVPCIQDSSGPGAEDDLGRPPGNLCADTRYPCLSDRCASGQQIGSCTSSGAVDCQPAAEWSQGCRKYGWD
jgi:hypothetical protein